MRRLAAAVWEVAPVIYAIICLLGMSLGAGALVWLAQQ